MGALANGVALRKDPDFQAWVETAIVYTARAVILEAPTTPDHDVRLLLARETITTPSAIGPLMLSAVATNPDVAGKGATPSAVTEQTVLDKVAEAWTTLAKYTHPQGT